MSSMKRKDPKKNRILRNGESIRSDGRYCFRYYENGKQCFLYSWRLVETDPLPKGKRPCRPLREMEEEVLRNRMDGIKSHGKQMTVLQLFDRHNELKANVKKKTVKGRQHLRQILENDSLGSMSIDKVKSSDAKAWAIRMRKDFAYQTVANYKRSLNAVFFTAMEDDLLRKNPFNWDLEDVVEDDTVHKTALTDEQVDNLLSFMENDPVYKKHYNAVMTLLYTGLRISELCGLTDRDVDFENGYINIEHQLSYDTVDGYHIITPKTESGVRKIPLLSPARKALLEQMASRTCEEPVIIDGYSGFIFLNRKGYPMYASLYANTFTSIVKKYNRQNKESPFPKITPHHLRHTFATNMVRKKVTPKTLQYLLGHATVMMSLDYYTHFSVESVQKELSEIMPD